MKGKDGKRRNSLTKLQLEKLKKKLAYHDVEFLDCFREEIEYYFYADNARNT